VRALVTGGGGLVGKSVVKVLRQGQIEVLAPSSRELNLLDRNQVKEFFSNHQFDIVIHSAARVGGVLGNQTYPATFISENIQMQSAIMDVATEKRVKKLIFIASSCVYPPTAPLPLKENSLFSGKFEATNRWYATAKAAGIMQVEAVRLQYGLDWFSVLPTNVYGINDNFALATGHVVPSLLRKFAEAVKSDSDYVSIWGSGNPKRELIHADDLGNAVSHLMSASNDLLEPFMVNIGSNEELSIKDLAELLQQISGFRGQLVFDETFPDGVYQKTLDSGILRKTGWEPRIPLELGLRSTYDWVFANLATLRSNEIQNIQTKLGDNK
jgi:GDP-L-fucose synthase